MVFFVWQRWGIVVVAIAAVALVAGAFLGSALGISGPAGAYPIGLGLIAGGALTWYLGKRMNRNSTRQLLDPATGETVTLRNAHTFFFVPVEWWAPVFVVAGLVFFVMPLLAAGS